MVEQLWKTELLINDLYSVLWTLIAEAGLCFGRLEHRLTLHDHCSLTPSWKMFYWLRFFVTCAFSGLLVKTDRPVFSLPAHEHFILSRTVPLRQHAMFLCLHFAILDMSHISLKNWCFLHWFFWRADILVDNINRFFCAVIEQRILADVY